MLRALATAAGAPPKWVLNAQALLGLPPGGEGRSRELALTRVLEQAGFRLADAHARARLLLEAEARGEPWPEVGRGGLVQVTVDRARFESCYALRCAAAASLEGDERRGRPRLVRESGLERAQRYGTDVSLLEASLRRSVAERLDRLDADVEFLRSLRVARR